MKANLGSALRQIATRKCAPSSLFSSCHAAARDRRKEAYAKYICTTPSPVPRSTKFRTTTRRQRVNRLSTRSKRVFRRSCKTVDQHDHEIPAIVWDRGLAKFVSVEIRIQLKNDRRMTESSGTCLRLWSFPNNTLAVLESAPFTAPSSASDVAEISQLSLYWPHQDQGKEAPSSGEKKEREGGKRRETRVC
jgi:hypothetical protein